MLLLPVVLYMLLLPVVLYMLLLPVVLYMLYHIVGKFGEEFNLTN